MPSTFDPHKVEAVTNCLFFKGECQKFEVRDPTEVPNRVLDRLKPFTIEICWRFCGNEAASRLTALAVSSPNWVVEVFAESVGPGPEIQIAQALVPVLPLQGSFCGDLGPPCFEPCYCYCAVMTVPPNTLPEGNPGPGPSGVYKLMATVFLNSTLGAPGFDICGFCEGPVIKIESPI